MVKGQKKVAIRKKYKKRTPSKLLKKYIKKETDLRAIIRALGKAATDPQKPDTKAGIFLIESYFGKVKDAGDAADEDISSIIIPAQTLAIPEKEPEDSTESTENIEDE